MFPLVSLILPLVALKTVSIHCEHAAANHTPSLAEERKVFRELFAKYEQLELKYQKNNGSLHPDDVEELRQFYKIKKEDLKKVATKELPPEERCIYLRFTQYLKKVFLGDETPPKLSGTQNCPYLKTIAFLKKYVCANEKQYPTEEDRQKCPWIKATTFIVDNKNLVIGALVFFAFLSCWLAVRRRRNKKKAKACQKIQYSYSNESIHEFDSSQDDQAKQNWKWPHCEDCRKVCFKKNDRELKFCWLDNFVLKTTK